MIMLCNNVKDIVLFYHVFNSKNNFIFPVTLIRSLYIETIIEKNQFAKLKTWIYHSFSIGQSF